MQTRILGKTGLQVSRLGAGLSEIGIHLTLAQEDRAGAVLNRALDAGISFLDTSACYGISEELIGRTVAHRRQEYVLATKCGHVTGGYEGEAWTARTITDSIDRSLQRMRTDYLDLVQLHSCDLEVLQKGEATAALLAAREAGKTRFVGYSGDNEAALWAVESELFDTLQTSFSLVDQKARKHLFAAAQAANMGLITKRPLGNGAWGATESPSEYADEYFRRAQILAADGPIPGAPDHRILLSLGFTWAHDAIDTIIVGTQNPDHMQANIDWVDHALPIADEAVAELQRRFDALTEDWPQRG